MSTHFMQCREVALCGQRITVNPEHGLTIHPGRVSCEKCKEAMKKKEGEPVSVHFVFKSDLRQGLCGQEITDKKNHTLTNYRFLVTCADCQRLLKTGRVNSEAAIGFLTRNF